MIFYRYPIFIGTIVSETGYFMRSIFRVKCPEGVKRLTLFISAFEKAIDKFKGGHTGL